MDGWKTWAGAALVLLGGALHALGAGEIAAAAYTIGIPMVVIGLGHKLDKVVKAMRALSAALESSAAEIEKGLAKTEPPAAPPAA